MLVLLRIFDTLTKKKKNAISLGTLNFTIKT